MSRELSISVVIPCHNYGRFLADAINSVLRQRRGFKPFRPKEILVVDDASTDDTVHVARQFAGDGVRYIRVDNRDKTKTRLAGLKATTGDVLCFLDADDMLDDDYLASALPHFADPRVGIVYSEMILFGDDRVRTIRFPSPDAPGFEAWFHMRNCCHSASLVRREALMETRALESETDPLATEDWVTWMRIVNAGWRLGKQNGMLRYRQHAGNKERQNHVPFFHRANLRHETVTLFIALSGRHHTWPKLSMFLTDQQWPHEQIRLVLCDTSQDDEFTASVRSWATSCDYADVRHFTFAAGEPGLADRNRRLIDNRRAVQRTMSRIYNRMLAELTTEFVWVVEDDVIPPHDACERLLRGFDRLVASVALPVRSPYHDGYIAWDENGRMLERGTGIVTIGGNGFGCTMLRRSVLRQTRFTSLGKNGDFDAEFYNWLAATPYEGRIDWDGECEHLVIHRRCRGLHCRQRSANRRSIHS